MKTYYNAQICESGHVVAERDYEFDESPYCTKCGSKIFSNCPSCNAQIRGGDKNDCSVTYIPPIYCDKCGKALPWQKSND